MTLNVSGPGQYGGRGLAARGMQPLLVAGVEAS
jgi:hypothetical protein